MRRLVLVAALTALHVAGCAGTWGRGGFDCPVALVPSHQIVMTDRQRYRVSIEAGGVLRRAEAVAFRDGDAWVLVGFTPFNTRLFALRQEGIETTVQDRKRAERFGIDPIQLQDAFHRAVFVRAAPAPVDPEGVTTWSHGGEDIRDTRRAGTLVARVFTSSASTVVGRDAARISIEYIAAPPAGSSAPSAPSAASAASAASASWTIDNPSCGYQATVVTLEPHGSRQPRP